MSTLGILVVLILASIVAYIFSATSAVEKYSRPTKKTNPPKKNTKPAKNTNPQMKMSKPAAKTNPPKKTTKPVGKTNPPKKTTKPVSKTNPPITGAPAVPTTPPITGAPTVPAVPTTPPIAAPPPFEPTYAPVPPYSPPTEYNPTRAPTGAPASTETSIPRPYGCPTREPYFNKCDMEFDCSLKHWGTTDKPRHGRSDNTCELVAVNFGRDSATFTFTKVGVAQRARVVSVGNDIWNPTNIEVPFAMETGPGVPGTPDFMKITVPYNPPGPDPENDMYVMVVETTPPGVLSAFVKMGVGTYRFYPWAANPARKLTLTPW